MKKYNYYKEYKWIVNLKINNKFYLMIYQVVILIVKNSNLKLVEISLKVEIRGW